MSHQLQPKGKLALLAVNNAVREILQTPEQQLVLRRGFGFTSSRIAIARDAVVDAGTAGLYTRFLYRLVYSGLLQVRKFLI